MLLLLSCVRRPNKWKPGEKRKNKRSISWAKLAYAANMVWQNYRTGTELGNIWPYISMLHCIWCTSLLGCIWGLRLGQNAIFEIIQTNNLFFFRVNPYFIILVTQNLHYIVILLKTNIQQSAEMFVNFLPIPSCFNIYHPKTGISLSAWLPIVHMGLSQLDHLPLTPDSGR